MELTSEKKDGSQVKLTVKFVGTCEPGDYQNFQVFNIILRECLAHLNLQLIRRNYYDPAAKVRSSFVITVKPSIYDCSAISHIALFSTNPSIFWVIL